MGYQYSLESVKDEWCSLFDEAAAEVMNYYYDLEFYWKRSYGQVRKANSWVALRQLWW